MKRIFTIVLIVLLLFGCDNVKKKDYYSKYYDLIELVSNRDEFSNKSSFFDINAEITKLSDGTYRYYITIDNPRISMHEIEAIAVERDVDYSNEMAANVGLFDEKMYSMIPNQVAPDKDYYQGITISGVSNKENPTVYVLIQWKNSELSETYREYFKFDINNYE